jgi:hypothetical protein
MDLLRSSKPFATMYRAPHVVIYGIWSKGL